MRCRRAWTPAKRQRARQKANVALRRRRELIERVRDRQDSAYAGFLPVAYFMTPSMGLPEKFQKRLGMHKGNNAQFQPQDEAMAVLGRLMLGIRRREHLDQLLPEQLLAKALGIRRWPSADTERRFYIRFTEEGLLGLDRILERQILPEAIAGTEGPLHVDIDVTGLPSQARRREGVRPGYMGGPIKPGYHNPRVSVQGVVIWTDLVPGDDNAGDVFDRGLSKVRLIRRILPEKPLYLTGDSQFGFRQNLEKVHERAQKDKHFGFFIGGSRQYSQREWWDRTVGRDRGTWKDVNKTTRIQDLGFQEPWGAEGPRLRVVRVEQEDWRGKAHARKTGRKARASAASPKKKVRHYVIYTGMAPDQMTDREVFRTYHQGQRREFDIKDGKQSYAIGNLPVRELRGNRAYTKMAGLAQAIVTLYQRKFLGAKPWGLLGRTLRETTFKIGGKNPDRWGGPA